MPESLDQLRDALTEAPVHPLPAVEVRRLGDRRRRRTASLVAGAALAAAAVVPLTLRDGGHDASGPAGPSPLARPWARTISAGFPIIDGMSAGAHARIAATVGADPGRAGFVVTGRACEQVTAWSVANATFVALAADGAGGSRALALYPDNAVAAAALTDASAAVTRCDARRVPAGTLLPQELETNAGEDSYAFVDPDESGWVVTALTRVGNAVLVDRAPAPALPVPSGADPLVVSGQAQADQMARQAERVVSAMRCAFAALPCPTGYPVPSTTP
jgi:hypothetical protein